jgi:hypothetical protein
MCRQNLNNLSNQKFNQNLALKSIKVELGERKQILEREKVY